MSRGKPRLSDTERELFGLEDGGGYVRPPTKPAERPKPRNVQTPAAAIVADEQPAVIPEVTEPISIQIVRPTDSAPPEAASVTNRRTGRIRIIYPDNKHGFIRMPNDERDIYFNNRTCFGLLRALRPDDEVTFLLEEGERGPWARLVERTWKTTEGA